MKNEFLRQIKACQAILEAEYTKIGQSHGLLMENLDKKLASNREILSQSRSRLKAAETSGISGLINTLEESTRKMDEGVNGLSDELQVHLVKLKENLDHLKETDSLILEIREYSEVMELIALNAMVVAIKAGKNGGGFTYITDVLKKNASSTLFLTDEVIELGKMIQSEFISVGNISSELDQLKSSMAEHQLKIGNGFSLYHAAVEKYSSFLGAMEQKIKDLKKPLLEIMEALQYQDIIRQSFDHILVMLGDIPEDVSEGYEAHLNYLSFFELIVDFSVPLMEEKRKDIQKNIDLFKKNTGIIKENLIHLDNEKEEYLNKQRNTRVEEGSLFDGLARMSQDFGVLQTHLHTIHKKLNYLTSNMGNISGSVRNLKEKNSRFERLIKLFRNITLMGRIEVTKHIALQDVELSVDSIADVTDKIEESVEKINNFTENVLDENEGIALEFVRLLDTNHKFIDEYKLRSDELGTGMMDLDAMFERSLGALDLYSSDIRDSLSSSLQSFKGLESSIDCIRKTIGELGNFRLKIQEDKRKCLKENNLKEWKLKDKNLEKILNEFTIHEQKQKVSHLSGNSVVDDSGVDSGSITMF